MTLKTLKNLVKTAVATLVSFSMLNSPVRQNPKKLLGKVHFWRLAGQKTAGF